MKSRYKYTPLVALFAIVLLLGISNIISQSYTIANFNAPILNWNQVRYSEPWVGTIIYLYSYSTHIAEYQTLIQGKIDFATLDHYSEIETLLTQYKGTVFVAISPVQSFGQLVFAFGNNLTANLYFRYTISSLINPQNVTQEVWDNRVLGQDIPYFVSPQIYASWFNPAVI